MNQSKQVEFRHSRFRFSNWLRQSDGGANNKTVCTTKASINER